MSEREYIGKLVDESHDNNGPKGRSETVARPETNWKGKGEPRQSRDNGVPAFAWLRDTDPSSQDVFRSEEVTRQTRRERAIKLLALCETRNSHSLCCFFGSDRYGERQTGCPVFSLRREVNGRPRETF